ncbi:hypothetical protein K469DRAFT_195015 [Zopfia rhizophila CBS 207.26]|uniref:gamma-glutamylcyclotransferase n=1 Tax=Zopfia rhizophila CBS 207.26 TaxID=1314779 RepID=A0A6A6EU42_9PEZI|nr:hypothetical protein K469DRAFT_195015 [Zopfia rhizophila CBS 207.26]
MITKHSRPELLFPMSKALFLSYTLKESTFTATQMSSLSQPSPGSEESGAGELYFAYGSNMHLQQMAARCGDSTLFAKGILRNYRWQTNSRGGGNVIEGNQEDFVEGIVFTVSPSDVRALRRYEGVEQQIFVERKFDIEVERVLDTALEGRKPADVAKILAQYNSGQSKVPDKFSHDKPSTSKAEEPEGEKVFRKALVYISYKYQLPGDIREEYIARMQLAMADARMLGVSKNYLETSLYPQVFGKRTGARPDEIRSLQQRPAPRTPSLDQSLNSEQ